MKNKLLLTLALGLAGAAPLMAATSADIYITGSTAFRANCYTACQKLFVGGNPTINYGDAAHGGASSGAKAASWVMQGTPVTALTNFNGVTLNIHGLFTGSIQGIQSAENSQGLIFAVVSAANGNNATTYTTNAPTIAFSDSSSVACPYPVDGQVFAEEKVCVQPFLICKSQSTNSAMLSVTNVTWDQLYSGIPLGYIPLSAWTFHVADTNTPIYLYERTGDSGTRRTLTQDEQYSFGDPVAINIYDPTNNSWYVPTVETNFNFGVGSLSAGVIGSEGPGNGNANLNPNWGFGYIGGGDIANTLAFANTNNNAIACLSLSDSKGVNASTNWATVIALDGTYPTVAGAGIYNNKGTNDFSPVTQGYWPLWGYEVIVFPTGAGETPTITGQNITTTQLGYTATGNIPGSFLGVFNNQSSVGGVPVAGSIENEIYLTETVSASFPNTAIRLNEMLSSRQQVSGAISPF